MVVKRKKIEKQREKFIAKAEKKKFERKLIAFCLRMPEEMHNEIDRAAYKEACNMTTWILRILKNELKKDI